MKLPAHRAGLPGDVNTITGSVFLPAYLPTAGRQGGASNRLAREFGRKKGEGAGSMSAGLPSLFF